MCRLKVNATALSVIDYELCTLEFFNGKQVYMIKRITQAAKVKDHQQLIKEICKEV